MWSNVSVAAAKRETDKGRHLIRVLLVADPGWLRQALALIIHREPDFTVVAQVGAPVEAGGALDEVDVAVVNLGVPDAERVEVVREPRSDADGPRRGGGRTRSAADICLHRRDHQRDTAPGSG